MTLPWLNPFHEEWSNWEIANRHVAWPNVHDPRRKKGFWFIGQPPLVAPMFSRVITRMFYVQNTIDTLWAEIPCESISQHNFGGTSGVNELGQRLDLLVTDHVVAHPEFGERGVHWQFLYHRDGFSDDVTIEQFFPGTVTFFGGVPFWWDWARNRSPPPTVIVYRTSFEDGQDTDWSTTDAYDRLLWATCPMGRVIPNNPVVA